MTEADDYEEWVKKLGAPALTDKEIEALRAKADRLSQSQVIQLLDEIRLLRWLAASLMDVLVSGKTKDTSEFVGLAKFLLSARRKE